MGPGHKREASGMREVGKINEAAMGTAGGWRESWQFRKRKSVTENINFGVRPS